jgi:hypothetical protein
MDSTQMISVPLAEIIRLNTENGIKDQRIKDLEERIAQLLLNPPSKPRKPAEKKILTPEEQEALHLKRVEAGKKGAATKKANEALRKEQERQAMIAELLAQKTPEQIKEEEAAAVAELEAELANI